MAIFYTVKVSPSPSIIFAAAPGNRSQNSWPVLLGHEGPNPTGVLLGPLPGFSRKVFFSITLDVYLASLNKHIITKDSI